MPHVGVERLGARDHEHDGAQSDEPPPRLVEQEPQAGNRRERSQDPRMLRRLDHAGRRQNPEPHHHHRAEQFAHGAGPEALDREQTDDDHERDRDDQSVQVRFRDTEPFDCRQHGRGRCDHPVAVEERGAEDSECDQAGSGPRRPKRCSLHE